MYIENPMTKVVGFFVFEPYKEFKVIGENLNEPTCYVVKSKDGLQSVSALTSQSSCC